MRNSYLWIVAAGRTRDRSGKAVLIAAVCLAASLAMQSRLPAQTLIYGFNDSTISGFTNHSATVSESTSIGVTEGAGAMEIANTAAQTYGGGLTATVPANFYNSTSFNIDVTITTPVTTTYFDLVPVFFSTDGEIDPDLGNSSSFLNLGATGAGTKTYTLDLDAYMDPEGNLTGDATPGQILAADQAHDGNNTDQITGFQLTVEHGSGLATTLYVDNVTVPVPEPASLLGLGGISGLLMLRRRRVA
jgi:hypothetical protein